MKHNNLCTLYIVRHGESQGNVYGEEKKPFDSALETTVPLTEKGRQQAQTLAEKFKHIHFDAIFSSDYPRTKETAEILKFERKLAVMTTEAIRERNYGKWAGRWHLIKDQLQEEIKIIAEEEKMEFVFEDVETEEHTSSRLITFIREIAVAYPGKTVLVVCHGNLMRTVLWKLGYATYHELPPGSIENTAYYIVESDGTDLFLKDVQGVNKRDI